MTPDRWHRLMRQLDTPDSDDVYSELVAAYAEKHRHYHTNEHIEDCLQQFDTSANLAQQPAEVELALWFHDAVYNPMSQDNERRSADWSRQFLAAAGADPNRCDRVYDHIMATRHEPGELEGDAALVVDVDLSILGRDQATYDAFENNVRREYRWVPSALFRKKRAEILQSFLDRDAIYTTAAFHERYEDAARRNIEAAIGALQQ